MKSWEGYRNKHQYFLQQRIIILFIFILFCNESFPQSYPFRHYTAKDGLSSSEVYHVFQDSKGYIWFATDNGVSRYDGYEFKNYTKDNGLPDNTVFEIYEDYKNRIWFVPHSAKLSYYYNESIFQYRYNDTLLSRMRTSTSPNKLSFVVDSADNIFYGDKRNGAFIIDSSGFIKEINKKVEGSVLLIKEDRVIFDKYFSHKNYKSYENAFIIFANDKMLFRNPNKSLISNYLLGNEYRAIKKGNNIFITCINTLIHIKNLSDLSYTVVPKEIFWINTDSNNNLWIGTINGTYCYENLGINRTPKHHLLKDKKVSSVLNDNEGGYWFTTLYDGVYYLPNLYTYTLRKNNELPNQNINSLTSDSTHIWLGLNNKIVGIISNKIDKEIKLDNYNSNINKLLFDFNNQKFWIASSSLYSYQNTVLNLYKFKTYTNTIVSIIQAKDIILYNEDTICVATSTGMYQYNTKKGNYYLDRLNKFTYKINSICQKQQENYLLCGYNDGLREYSLKNNTFKYLGDQHKLLSSHINCIINNNYHSNNWLGTKSNGVVVYGNDTIYNISTKDGLSNNTIRSFFQKENVMWVATVNGLNKITLKGPELKTNYEIEAFGTIHGIVSNEIKDIYVSDSSAYIATKEGITIIDYNKIKPNTCLPPVYIKNISINDNDTIIQKHYNLPYRQNSINIEYVGLMYRNNEKKKYKYQLNKPGKPANWIETPDNYVNLSYLSPGKYNFQVIAINEDGYESNVPASLSFTINPPYWKTWWFRGIIFLTGFLLIYIFYRLRIHEVNKRNNLEKKLLKQVNKFRQQALSQQMNPHFIFNTLNSIQFYIFKNDSSASIRYLAKFSKLMRIILDNSQHDTISLQRELDAMELYMELESLRLKNSIEYEINVHENVDTELYQVYPLLIQPYVENSIWHGLVHKEGGKRVKIELVKQDDYIKCTVEDNGVGREKAMEIKKQKKSKHKSHGINITGKRIDMINKLYNRNFKVDFIDLRDKGGKACGTRVILQIPIIWNEKFNQKND